MKKIGIKNSKCYYEQRKDGWYLCWRYLDQSWDIFIGDDEEFKKNIEFHYKDTKDNLIYHN